MLGESIYKALIENNYSEGDRLPSVRELMKHFSVSSATIQKVLTKLDKEGFIVRIKGKGCFWGNENQVILELPKKSKETLCEELFERDWQRGLFKLGKPLPSFKELCVRYECNVTTLKKVISKMVLHQRLFQKGRNYFIYGDRFLEKKTPLGQILFITRCDSLGEFKAESERELDFLRNIYKKALELNYKLTLLGFDEKTENLYDRSGKLTSVSKFPSAIAAIVSTLLVQNPLKLLRTISGFSFPVAVWWEHPEKLLSNSFLKKKNWSFFNSTFGELSGIELGKFLLKNGIKEVAYFSPYHKSSWSKDRLSGLKKADIKVLEFTDSENASPFDFRQKALLVSPEYATAFFSRQLTREVLLKLSKDSPSEIPWVCVNDEVAGIFKELSEEGKIKISNYLISFDNSAESYLLRLDSFDFNTETLVEQMYLSLENPKSQGNRQGLIEIIGNVVIKN